MAMKKITPITTAARSAPRPIPNTESIKLKNLNSFVAFFNWLVVMRSNIQDTKKVTT